MRETVNNQRARGSGHCKIIDARVRQTVYKKLENTTCDLQQPGVNSSFLDQGTSKWNSTVDREREPPTVMSQTHGVHAELST